MAFDPPQVMQLKCKVPKKCGKGIYTEVLFFFFPKMLFLCTFMLAKGLQNYTKLNVDVFFTHGVDPPHPPQKNECL